MLKLSFSSSISPALGVHVAARANPSSLSEAGLHPHTGCQFITGSHYKTTTAHAHTHTCRQFPVANQPAVCAENQRRTTQRTCRKGPRGLVLHVSDGANGCCTSTRNQRWEQKKKPQTLKSLFVISSLLCSVVWHREGFWLSVCGRLFCFLCLAGSLSRYFDLFPQSRNVHLRLNSSSASSIAVTAHACLPSCKK